MTYDDRGRMTAAPLVGLRRRPFRLPLHHPLETARGAIEVREGAVVEALDAAGLRGLGEASPLEAYGEGSADDVLRLLDAYGAAILERGALPDGVDEPGAAALRCALDTALLDLEGQRRQLPLAALLNDRPIPQVEVNAVLGEGSLSELEEEVRNADAAGYGTLKLKVGGASLEADRRRVETARNAAPSARLRLDANGAWTEPEAAAALERLARYDLEYVEQPVPADDLGALARIRGLQLCRVAADEAASSPAAARRVLAVEAADLLILKPLRLGGLRPAYDIAREAAEARVPCVVTTTFDSSIGTAAALQLAAAVPHAGLAHGLGTGGHLAADLVATPLRPWRGKLRVPPSPGLGVQLDDASLEGVATGAWYAVRT